MDNQAIGACNALFRMGRLVPEHVKVGGVDNSPICELAAVPLRSVSQEFRQRGAVAMQMLLQLLFESDKKETFPTSQSVSHVRESSAMKAGV